MSTDIPHSGHQMGRILSHLIANTVHDVRQAMAPAEAEHRKQHVEGMMDNWEVALGERLGQVLSDLEFGDEAPEILKLAHEISTQPGNAIDLLIQIILFIPFAFFGAGQASNIVYRNFFNTLNEKFPSQPIGPSAAAEGFARGYAGRGWAQQEALFSGVRAEAFDVLADVASSTPGIGELLTMLQRRLIGPGEVALGLGQLGIRAEWIERIIGLAHAPMPGSVGVEAVLKGVLDEGTGAAIWALAGGRATDFGLAVEAAGNAIGVEAAGRLFSHGLISEGQLSQVIRYSHINPKFEPIAELLRFHWLSAFQVHNLVQNGTIDSPTAKRWLIEDGYSAEQAEALSHSSQKPSTKKAKTATESLIIDTFEAGFASRDTTVQHLVDIGYTPGAADILLDAYDARQALSAMKTASGKVHQAFLARRIDKQTASTDLDRIGVHPNVRDRIIADWEVEKETDFKVLSVAQVGAMLKQGILAPEQATQRWRDMGYSAGDADLLGMHYLT